MRSLVPLILIALTIALNFQDTAVQVKYDRFEGKTSVVLFEMPLARGEANWLPTPGDNPNQLSLTLIDVFSGRTAKAKHPDDSVYFVLSGKADIGLLSPPTVTFLIDGETRLTLATEWSKDEYDKAKRYRSVKVPMTYQLLNRLVSTKTTEGKLGQTEFHFSGYNKDEIKRFIKSTSP